MAAVELTQDEAKALLALIDIAVKAAGLQVAQAAGVLAAKIAPVAEQADAPVPAPAPAPALPSAPTHP